MAVALHGVSELQFLVLNEGQRMAFVGLRRLFLPRDDDFRFLLKRCLK